MSITECASLDDHTERVWHVSWSPCGSKLASCGADKGLRIWEITEDGKALLESGKAEMLSAEHWKRATILEEIQSRTLRCCEFSPNGLYLATASFDSTTAIWKKDETSNAWKFLSSLEGHENEVKSVAWSHDNHYLATCSRDKSIWIWENPDAELGDNMAVDSDIDWDCVTVLHGHSQDIKSVCWSPIENVLYSASYDDTIKIWAEEVDDWGCLGTLSGHANTVWELSFHPSGNLMASSSQDCSIHIWENVKTEIGYTWKDVQTLDKAHNRTVFSVDWSKFGMIVSCGADDTICTYTCQRLQSDPVSLNCKLEKAHDTDVNCVKWNPVFEGLFASASDDTKVKIWFAKK
mmetsp:Transcript_12605/g.14457  ORF Transcript_12605/g.14457 Transcript_12605/m.14457 type:complete len:349 (-) Transcript_12605:200-1246(-)